MLSTTNDRDERNSTAEFAEDAEWRRDLYVFVNSLRASAISAASAVLASQSRLAVESPGRAHSRLAGRGTLIVALWALFARPVFADDPLQPIESRTFTVTPRAIESPLMKYRLLPAEYELRDGNAAPILLRMPWDQLPYMNQIRPKFPDMLLIPMSESERIRAAGEEIRFDTYYSFYSEMRRAAYRRSADWEYPLDEHCLFDIPLPDVQGMRDFMRGLAVWIRAKIAEGDTANAREGVLVGLANARHVARTPFVITNLVATNAINLMLDRLDELQEHSACPNLYWALAALPAPLLDLRAACEFERIMLDRTIPAFSRLDEPRSRGQWDILADQTLEALHARHQANMGADAKVDAPERRTVLSLARAELPALAAAGADAVPLMSDGECILRWLNARHADFGDRAIAYVSLSIPEAMRCLKRLDEERSRLVDREPIIGRLLTHNLPPLGMYLMLVRCERRVAASRVVEAIRQFAATNDGAAPERLDQMTETPVIADPFTAKPFGYEKTGTGFRLTAPPVVVAPNAAQADQRWKYGFEWRVELKRP